MGVIAALVPNQVRLQRLRAAARDVHVVIPCEDWDELHRLAERQVIHLVVLDLQAAGAPNFDPVRRLKGRLPRAALIAYVALAPDRARNIFDAGRFGFEALVVADIDDGPTNFGRAIDKAAARGVSTLVRESIPNAAGTVAYDALLVAVTRAHQRLTPSKLAEVVGVHPRQLTRQLAATGYPSASRLLTWGRLLVAAEMLDDTRHSGTRIATTLHFPSASAFRNMCQRYLRATPGEIRAAGGVTFVLEALLRELGPPPSSQFPGIESTG